MIEKETGKIVVNAAIAMQRELKVERQTPVSIEYRGMRFDEGVRSDIMIDGKVILEMK